MPLHHEKPSKFPKAMALAQSLTNLIPTLHTKRLILRAPQISDFSVYAKIALSPKGHFILMEPNRENAWYDFVNMIACWLLRGHGLWSVERKQDNAVIGFVLISFEPGDHEPELGYMIIPQAESCGYATEAAAEAKHYAFDALGFTTLASAIDHDNTASFKVAQKLGGVRDRKAEKRHDDEILILRYSYG
ncbi:MAG: GNAT family N-acetyltransferase [Pseudomonadota bacterium]